MERLTLKPTHKAVQNYYEVLEEFESLGVSHEGAVRTAFQHLLETCGKQFGWKLIPEWRQRDKAKSIQIDGALVDEYRMPHGFWEAKDTHDDLAKEVKRKISAGYPQNNIIFQAPQRAILWQNGRAVRDLDLTQASGLVEIVKQFFDYLPPEHQDWQEAVEQFQHQFPELGKTLKEIIEREQKSNARFRAAFEDFFALCRQSINPNLSKQAVEEMLIQHLLTERIFRTVFNNPDFTRRNVIAAEIEKVIDALTSQAFSRDAFLQRLDRFYGAVEKAAWTIEDFTQKQEFLNTVYEKFFQGFSVKVADTHGIVYTPVSIVNFMVRSVEDILRKEFGKSLSSSDVHILDPFVGTGNFIVHIMQHIKKTELAKKYKQELHCNEVMLLPYYIASMNIEHEFFELSETYEAFPGICFVDTFELAEAGEKSGEQTNWIDRFTAENTARVERQKSTAIKVVIGNPPYNAWQLNENDNNKNRKYRVMNKRVADTYARASRATNKNALSDPYVKAFRWASDRIGEEGIVAFVSNNSFVDNLAFDGMRKHLAQDFDEIYIIDLGGNVRKNPKLSGTTNNVFGIKVGVSINLFVRKLRGIGQQIKTTEAARGDEIITAKIHYGRVDEYWRKEQKYAYLEEKQHVGNIEFHQLLPDKNENWLTGGLQEQFETLIPIGSKKAKAGSHANAQTIFKVFSGGVKTNRDAWVYNFHKHDLIENVKRMIESFNQEAYKWSGSRGDRIEVDDFVVADTTKVSWSETLKNHLARGNSLTFQESNIRTALYRPYVAQNLYFERPFNERVYVVPSIFPLAETEEENCVICVGGYGRKAFAVLMTNRIPDLNFYADPAQCFPFYTYNEDGSHRRENITDWALEQFRSYYQDESITKRDIFHYVYSLLHHPLYRDQYAANLKRELPRIPYTPDFRAFAEIGKRLADIHVNYAQQQVYLLEKIEAPDKPLDWRVERMKLSKDKHSLIYNEFLTLDGIPAEALEYRLGNRSALEWIIDQYQVSIDKRSGITNDPNRADDPQYIVRLIGQVITVSVETVQLIRRLNNVPLM